MQISTHAPKWIFTRSRLRCGRERAVQNYILKISRTYILEYEYHMISKTPHFQRIELIRLRDIFLSCMKQRLGTHMDELPVNWPVDEVDILQWYAKRGQFDSLTTQEKRVTLFALTFSASWRPFNTDLEAVRSCILCASWNSLLASFLAQYTWKILARKEMGIKRENTPFYKSQCSVFSEMYYNFLKLH